MSMFQFEEMAEKAKAGQEVKITVRTLLSRFSMCRRSAWNVRYIRHRLAEAGVTTSPDFEATYIDGLIDILPAEAASAPAQPTVTDGVSIGDTLEVELTHEAPALCLVRLADPAHRISRLESANRPPAYVSPDAPIAEAITLMLLHDYSQLPVMQSDREVKGLFSWKSYGSRLASAKPCTCVRDGMDSHREIPSDASLFDAVKIIAEHDCVLIRDGNRKICGIVTAYDISEQFQQLAEPFLLLADIENHVRYLLGNAFTPGELQQAKDPGDEDREIKDAADLTFGEYIRLLQNEDNWAKLGVPMDRKVFVGNLDRIREIRNDVMHFDPDPMDPADLGALRDFARLLARWHQLTATP